MRSGLLVRKWIQPPLWGRGIFHFKASCQDGPINSYYDVSALWHRDWGEEKCNIAINIFLSQQTRETWHLSLCLKGGRHCAGTSSSLITAVIKTTSEICDKDPGAIFSHPPVQTCFPCSPPPLPVPAKAAGMTDDITQQGFSRRYHHEKGISMETPGPLSPTINSCYCPTSASWRGFRQERTETRSKPQR